MRTLKLLFWAAAGMPFLLMSCGKETITEPLPVVDCETVTWSGDIETLIQTRCAMSSCHGAGASIGDLSSYEHVKRFVDNGQIMTEVVNRRSMPPGGGLPESLVSEIKCWLDAGAPKN